MWNAFKKWLANRSQVVNEEEAMSYQEIEVNGFSFLMMPAEFEDVDDMVALEQSVFGEAIAWTADIFRDDLQNNLSRQYLVLRQPETTSLVGYIGIEIEQESNQVHVTSITIAPHWQGRAIGTFLMTYILMWAQRSGFSQMYLEVRASDEDAQRFYRRLGFERTDTISEYYGVDQDAYQMVNELSRYRGEFL